MNITVTPPKSLRGCITVPGDKSISHRALMFNTIANGSGKVEGFSPGGDCQATLEAMRMLGGVVERDMQGKALIVKGLGLNGLQEPTDVINVKNSGTTARLISGILAGRDMLAVITGDASIRKRPMRRVIKPLQRMGANIHGRGKDSYVPIVLNGGEMRGVKHEVQVASAQLKSALLLAGLRANGTTTVISPAISRDHTERMLLAMGAELHSCGPNVSIEPSEIHAIDINVPGDISSAAYWIIAAVTHKDAELTIRNVLTNSTRAGVLKVMREMGADVFVENERDLNGEPVADIIARSSKLKGIRINGDTIPSLIDEIPVLSVAAAMAEGETIVSDAEDLRSKETDRISAVIEFLRGAGVACEEKQDGFIVDGTGYIKGGVYSSFGDHRMAMSIGIAGLAANGQVTIAEAESVEVSYPAFWRELESLGVNLS